MYPRTNYEMTEAQLAKLLDAMKPVAYMVIGGMPPRSQQENANDAWAALGKEMGFDHMTVRPDGRGDRFFTAVPSETPEQQQARKEAEVEARKLAEVAALEAEIAERTERLRKLTGGAP